MLLNDFHEKTSQMVKIDPVRDRQTMDDPSRCATAKQWVIAFQIVNITYDDLCPLMGDSKNTWCVERQTMDGRFQTENSAVLSFIRTVFIEGKQANLF